MDFCRNNEIACVVAETVARPMVAAASSEGGYGRLPLAWGGGLGLLSLLAAMCSDFTVSLVTMGSILERTAYSPNFCPSCRPPYRLNRHVRVKRKQQTYFIPVERTTSFLIIKEKISSACGTNAITSAPNVPSSSITLYANISGEKELPDAGTMSDHEIANDAIIYAVFEGDKGIEVAEEDAKE